VGRVVIRHDISSYLELRTQNPPNVSALLT
jgi:hypothetical protein